MNSKRKRFFATALKIIYQKGFKATTMRDIARELDCDVSNIYNYIPSKQSLLETYLFQISAEFHDGIDPIIASSSTAREKLRAAVGIHVRLAMAKPYIIALLADEWRNLKSPALEKFLAEREAYEIKLNTIIDEGVRSGEFNTPNSKVTTYLVLSAVRWLHAMPQAAKLSVHPRELEKQVLDFIFCGLDQTSIKENEFKEKR